jgi:hypothetical protein
MACHCFDRHWRPHYHIHRLVHYSMLLLWLVMLLRVLPMSEMLRRLLWDVRPSSRQTQ